MNKLAILEGALFIVGEEGLTINQVIELLDISLTDAKELLEKLVTTYEENQRGITLALYGDRFKLTTKPEHKEYYQKLIETQNERELSNASLETLVVIAYNEPITRIKIDELRGVASAHVVRKLVAEDLIEVAGREDTPGKPKLYKTTTNFLDYFGLTSLDELPEVKDQTTAETEEDLFC